MFAHLRRHCLLWKTMVWLEFTLWERTDLPNKKIGPRVSLNLLIPTDWPCSYFQTQFSRTGPALSPLGMNTAPGSRSFSGRFFEAASATAAATWVFPVPAARPGASRCATFSATMLAPPGGPRTKLHLLDLVKSNSSGIYGDFTKSRGFTEGQAGHAETNNRNNTPSMLNDEFLWESSPNLIWGQIWWSQCF